MLRSLGREGQGPWQRDFAQHMKVRAGAKNIRRWTNITLDVEGDADRLACELLHEKDRKTRQRCVWEEHEEHQG